MRTGWRIVIGLGILIAVLWIAYTRTSPHRTQSVGINPPPLAETASESAESTRPTVRSAQPREEATRAATGDGTASVTSGPSEVITNWEDRVDHILTSDAGTADKAKEMLEIFPRLPEAGQVEVSKHLSNLVANEDYAPMGKLLVDAQQPPAVLDTLMGDLLNRPNSLKLPTLLEIARTPQHPKAGDAKEVLGFFLGADYNDDWNKWQETLAQWLKDNPD